MPVRGVLICNVVLHEVLCTAVQVTQNMTGMNTLSWEMHYAVLTVYILPVFSMKRKNTSRYHYARGAIILCCTKFGTMYCCTGNRNITGMNTLPGEMDYALHYYLNKILVLG